MKSIKSKLILFFSILMSVTILLVSFAGYIKAKGSLNKVANQTISEKLHSDISAMNSYFGYTYGQIIIKNGTLVTSTGVSVEGNNDIVDKVYQDLSDVASIYKKQGDDFVMVSTNIRDNDGARIEYENLDKDSAAYKSLINDEEFTGETIVNGEKYQSTYTLLVGRSGKTVGVLFVGVPVKDVEETIESGLSSIRVSFILIGAILLVINIIVTWIIGKRVTAGLINMHNYSAKLQQLDVSEDIPDRLINLKDEVGAVSKSIDIAVESLRNFAKDTDNISSEVRDYSSLLLTNMEKVDVTANEIANVIEEIANGATKQARDIEEGNFKAEELGKSIEANRSKLQEVIKYMSEAQELRKNGHTAVTNLSEESMKTINATNEIYDVIAETNDKAKDIERASYMIKDIAQQTNLLSLNAAIEAARAGESGKGFAVVAEEVSKLAEESNKLTEEIENIIKMLTERTENAVKTVDNMISMIKNQNISVESTVSKFEGISVSLEKTMDTIVELNKSSDEMNMRKDEIVDVMQNLSAIAEENAAATEEVAASVEEQTTTISQLGNSIEKMSDLAKNMKENASRFKYQ